MENQNIKELQHIAKEQKIKYYYNMRKDDLVRALQAPVDVRSLNEQRALQAPMLNQSILDEPIPDDLSSTILTPTINASYVPPQPPPTKSTNNNSIADWIMSTSMSGIDWIKNAPSKVINYGNEKYDSFKSKILNLFNKYRIHKPIEFKLTQSWPKNVTKQFTATSEKGYSALSFMNFVKK